MNDKTLSNRLTNRLNTVINFDNIETSVTVEVVATKTVAYAKDITEHSKEPWEFKNINSRHFDFLSFTQFSFNLNKNVSNKNTVSVLIGAYLKECEEQNPVLVRLAEGDIDLDGLAKEKVEEINEHNLRIKENEHRAFRHRALRDAQVGALVTLLFFSFMLNESPILRFIGFIMGTLFGIFTSVNALLYADPAYFF